MNITPELIPHTQFHDGVWLRNPSAGWYYFQKKKNPNRITNKDFLASVDEPLRNLVEHLHLNGIRTTPSCSGHCFRTSDLKKIFRTLEEDAGKIITDGLLLQDIETGKNIVFKNEKYELPWNKSDFVSRLEQYQQNGIIGIRPNGRKNLKKRLLEMDVPKIDIGVSDDIILLTTFGNGTKDNAEIWKKATREIQKMFKD